jgi:hypothetical protein
MIFKILILNIFLFSHPVHVTLISLNKDPGSETLKMTFRMYYDDFLLDYKMYDPDFEPGGINDPTKYFSGLIGSYFNERVKIYINGKLIPGKISELSVNDYEILMNLSYLTVRPPKNLRIMNQILTGIYSDQANMVYLNIDGYENAVKLTPGNAEANIKIK